MSESVIFIMLEDKYGCVGSYRQMSDTKEEPLTRSTMPVTRSVDEELLQTILRLSKRKVDDRMRNIM